LRGLLCLPQRSFDTAQVRIVVGVAVIASYCVADVSKPGVCVAKLPGGASCSAGSLCVSGSCTNGICKDTTSAQEIALFGYCSRAP